MANKRVMITARKPIYIAFTFLLIISGLGLLYLTNSGLLAIGKPYIRQLPLNTSSTNATVAFVDVNVIPMDRERLVPGQTVIVRDGLIESIENSTDAIIPEDAQIVQGTGKYLLPGLVDMHVHIEDENELLLYVANGVTSVRNLWGNTEKKLFMGMPDQLRLREQINRGELFGPTIYTSGPIMEGQPPTSPLMPVFVSPEEAVKSVIWQKEQGYDFIKVYDNLSLETYQAILQAAGEHNIPVVGHVPFAAGLEVAVAGGQTTIEHLGGYIDADAAAFIIPEDQLLYYAALTREAGIWNTPTIGLYQNTVALDDISTLESQPGVQYMSPLMRLLMRLFIRQLNASITYTGQDYTTRINEIYTQMTRVLHETGAKVVLGTDASNSYLVPGYSLLDEMDYLIEAGFTPYEAIEAGTRNAAEAMGKSDVFGTVEEGKRADLILTDLNPLEDMTNIRQRSGVMLRGRWLSQAELQTMLDELAASYTPHLLERIWPLFLVLVAIYLTWKKIF